ncbi:MAG: hypothetical protein FWF85_01345 [Clostridiales bacterium]|nr:hypothetical protein [Clostridiales bacterium]
MVSDLADSINRGVMPIQEAANSIIGMAKNQKQAVRKNQAINHHGRTVKSLDLVKVEMILLKDRWTRSMVQVTIKQALNWSTIN